MRNWKALFNIPFELKHLHPDTLLRKYTPYVPPCGRSALLLTRASPVSDGTSLDGRRPAGTVAAAGLDRVRMALVINTAVPADVCSGGRRAPSSSAARDHSRRSGAESGDVAPGGGVGLSYSITSTTDKKVVMCFKK